MERRDFSAPQKWAAEFIGTFWLTFGGCGSAVLAAGFPELGIGFAGVALAFGLTVLTGAYALGPISGGHFNPRSRSASLRPGASTRRSSRPTSWRSCWARSSPAACCT